MEKHRILLVDDEENILRSLERLFMDDGYEILTATSGEEALERLNGDELPLVISDQRMPRMQGVELLDKIKSISPDTLGILLTGHTDINAAIAAINSGAVYKYIEKPWDDEHCRLTVRRALEQYDLIQKNRRLTEIVKEQNEELKFLNDNLQDKVREKTEEIVQKNKRLEDLNEELKQSFVDATRVFSSLLEMRDDYVAGHSKRVAVASKEIARKYNLSEEELFDIEVAALLHDIGKIGLRDNILKAPSTSISFKENRDLQKQHAIMGHMSLLGIESLQNAATMIRHHHEHYDGTGVPDGLKGKDIPLGSRIIAVVDAFDGLRFRRESEKPCSQETASSYLLQSAGTRFDPNIVQKFLKFLKTLHKGEVSRNVVRVSAKDLREDMVIARDVVTANNMLLIARNEQIKKSYLERIRYYIEGGQVKDDFYIYGSGEPGE